MAYFIKFAATLELVNTNEISRHRQIKGWYRVLKTKDISVINTILVHFRFISCQISEKKQLKLWRQEAKLRGITFIEKN